MRDHRDSDFLFIPQSTLLDCGAACLKMIAAHFGRRPDSGLSEKQSDTMMTMADLLAAAEQFQLRGVAAAVDYDRLADSMPFPCIVHWRGLHYVVVVDASPERVIVADPAISLYTLSRTAFCGYWMGKAERGIVAVFEPIPDESRNAH